MTSGEKKTTRTLKSRGITWLLLVVSAGCSAMWWALNTPSPAVEGGGGVWLPGFSENPAALTALLPGFARELPALCNLLIVAAIAFTMATINKVYNLLRTVSTLFVGLFALALAATPQLFVCLNSGVVLALAAVLCVLLLYSVYQEPQRTRRVFLVFCIIAFGGIWEWGFVPFLLVFLIGVSQVRCLNARTFVAAVIGIVTPVWILWGFGAFNLLELRLPSVSDFRAVLTAPQQPHLLAVAALGLLSGFIFGVANLAKVISFNARTRAYWGLVSLPASWQG